MSNLAPFIGWLIVLLLMMRFEKEASLSMLHTVAVHLPPSLTSFTSLMEGMCRLNPRGLLGVLVSDGPGAPGESSRRSLASSQSGPQRQMNKKRGPGAGPPPPGV